MCGAMWIVVTLLLGILLAPVAAESQQSAKNYRLGLLVGSSEAFVAPYIEIFRQALRDLGYVEGRNIAIESRYADGNYDRLRVLAADLVRRKVDIIVTEGTPPTRAATQATTTIPWTCPDFVDTWVKLPMLRDPTVARRPGG